MSRIAQFWDEAIVPALVEYIRYLSTRDADTRLSPLAPRGSPAVRLPESASSELERGSVPPPLGGPLEPRRDEPPYAPITTEQTPSVKALP